MSKEKQIEEMKQDINAALSYDCSKARCLTCEFINEENCEPAIIAKALYNAGYRKQSEVAREIFEEIDVTWSERGCVSEFFENIAELKKKYTEGEQ